MVVVAYSEILKKSVEIIFNSVGPSLFISIFTLLYIYLYRKISENLAWNWVGFSAFFIENGWITHQTHFLR